MNSVKIFGKYLDQPKLVEKFSKTVPAIMIAGGAGFALHNYNHAPENEKKKVLKKDVIVIATTIAAALAAPKIASKLVKRGGHSHGTHAHAPKIEPSHIHEHEAHKHCEHHHEHHHNHEHEHIPALSEFLKENKVSEQTAKLLEKTQTKALKLSEIKTVFNELGDKKFAKKFLSDEHQGLIPDPENIDYKHLTGELGWLSIMGAIPVLGGIAGGAFADKVTGENLKETMPNKVKEGAYQYLANIFLCNIGAGAALFALEKAKITSKSARAVGMIGGIILTGIIGGSAIANYIGQKVINPLMGQKNKNEKLFTERKPEALDISLHADDIATVAVMSGLKWIEPALPILYGISGYRAGIGYRNEHAYDKFYYLLHNNNDHKKHSDSAYSAFA